MQKRKFLQILFVVFKFSCKEMKTVSRKKNFKSLQIFLFCPGFMSIFLLIWEWKLFVKKSVNVHFEIFSTNLEKKNMKSTRLFWNFVRSSVIFWTWVEFRNFPKFDVIFWYYIWNYTLHSNFDEKFYSIFTSFFKFAKLLVKLTASSWDAMLY